MKTLTEAAMKLAPPGGVFNETVVCNLFPKVSKGSRKLLAHRTVVAKEVTRLKPGLFVLGREYRRTEPHPYVIAAMLHSPSHVSMESALAHHGLIPETVQQVSSITAARNRAYGAALMSGVEDEAAIRHVDGERVIGSKAFAETLQMVRGRHRVKRGRPYSRRVN